MDSGRLYASEFGDLVAVSCINDEGGYTVYVEPDAARIFAKNILIDLDIAEKPIIKSRPAPGIYARCPICGGEIRSTREEYLTHPAGARFYADGQFDLVGDGKQDFCGSEPTSVYCENDHGPGDWKAHFTTPVVFVAPDTPPKPER